MPKRCKTIPSINVPSQKYQLPREWHRQWREGCTVLEVTRVLFASPDRLKMLCLSLHHRVGSECSCLPHPLQEQEGKAAMNSSSSFGAVHKKPASPTCLLCSGLGSGQAELLFSALFSIINMLWQCTDCLIFL